MNARDVEDRPVGGCTRMDATSWCSRRRPTLGARLVDILTELEDLRARVRTAERKAATLEDGLLSNRRIGMAVGILMCRLHVTEDDAFAVLRQHSQCRNTKVRELAETVIYTGSL